MENNDKEKSSIMKEIVLALKEAGYNPSHQISAYLTLNDPKYITRHNGARDKIQTLTKAEIEDYLKNGG